LIRLAILLFLIFFMPPLPPPTIGGERQYVFGLSSVRPLSVNACRHRITRYLRTFIAMKLGINIHHVSGYCWKGVRGQR